MRGDDAWTDDIVHRAVAAGYDAFAITVDTAAYSRRERDIAARFVKPWRTAASGHEYQAGFSWASVRRFKDRHRIPLILKGIATAEDAAIACEHGVDVIYVSNHGGRQLDHGRGAMEVLPDVLQAVRGRAKVMVDGGICRGTDVVKAMALGADAVAVGRLYCYGRRRPGRPACAGCWSCWSRRSRWRWRCWVRRDGRSWIGRICISARRRCRTRTCTAPSRCCFTRLNRPK